MKITSEITNKEYATVEECLKAEAEVKAMKEQAAANKTSTGKKKLAETIESCEKAAAIAHENLEIARGKVRELCEKAKTEVANLITKQNEEMKAILQPAEQAVKDAERAKFNAITTFNKQFGVYKKVYTGEEAIKDLRKSLADNSWIFDFLGLLD